MGRRISSPGDAYYQGKGQRPSNIEKGLYEGGTEEQIRKLMAPRGGLEAKKVNKFNGHPKEINELNDIA